MSYARGGGKRSLSDTSKVTKARMPSIRSHKLGFDGYNNNSIGGNVVSDFFFIYFILYFKRT